MRIPLRLAALVVLASGCLGGGGRAPAAHMVSVPDVVHPGGEPDAIGVSADAAGAALHRAHLRLASVVADVVGETLARAERRLSVAFLATIPPLPPSRVTSWEDAYGVSWQSPPAGTRPASCTSIRVRVRRA